MLSEAKIRILRDALLTERADPDTLPHEAFGLLCQADVLNFVLGELPVNDGRGPVTNHSYFREIMAEQEARTEDQR